jgi:aspartate carbamoyltransferase catalytic subunit
MNETLKPLYDKAKDHKAAIGVALIAGAALIGFLAYRRDPRAFKQAGQRIGRQVGRFSKSALSSDAVDRLLDTTRTLRHEGFDTFRKFKDRAHRASA